MGWRHFQSEQQDHGKQATVFGADGYVWNWGEATFENWQSEFLQLLTFVILSTYLIHRHSPQSRDSEDEMMKKVDAILERVKKLEGSREKRVA
jgi:hypothetical protein